MSTLKSVFILTLIRLMHREPCLTITKEMDHYPTEAEMLEFLESCIELDEGSRNFETIMKVEKIYKVVPLENNEPVSPMTKAWQKTFSVDPEDVRSDLPNEKDYREQYLDTPKEDKKTISNEQRELLKLRWSENGDCRSCGWHPAYYEVQDSIEESFLSNDFEDDGSIYVPCINEDEEDYNHRGSNIYNFHLDKQDTTN